MYALFLMYFMMNIQQWKIQIFLTRKNTPDIPDNSEKNVLRIKKKHIRYDIHLTYGYKHNP